MGSEGLLKEPRIHDTIIYVDSEGRTLMPDHKFYPPGSVEHLPRVHKLYRGDYFGIPRANWQRYPDMEIMTFERRVWRIVIPQEGEKE